MSSDVAAAYTELQEACSHVQQLRIEAQNSVDEAKEVKVKQQGEHEKTAVSMASLRKSHNNGVLSLQTTIKLQEPTNDAAPMTRYISEICKQVQTCHEVLVQNSNSNLHKADQLATSQQDAEHM